MGAIPDLASDTARVLQHPYGIKSAISSWWRGHLIAPADLKMVRGLDDTIESSINAIRGASPELSRDIARRFKAKTKLITQQMSKLQNNSTMFERELSKLTSQEKRLYGFIDSYRSQLEDFLTDGKLDSDKIRNLSASPSANIKDPAVFQNKIYETYRELIEKTDDLAEVTSAISITKGKKKYVDGLIIGVSTFNQKLEEGIDSGLKYLGELEKTSLKGGISPMLEELGSIENFSNQLKAELPKEVNLVLSEKLMSQNLDSKKYFLKEWARMKATKSKELYNMWKSNAKNAALIREIEDSDEHLGMFGKKFSEMARLIESDDVKSVSSFMGRSPQEITHMLGLPTVAVGAVRASSSVFKAFSWFSDSNITTIGDQAKTLSGEIEKLSVSTKPIKILIDTIKSLLSDIKSNSREIGNSFGEDPQVSIQEHVPNISNAILGLSKIHDRWDHVVSDSSDKILAAKIGNNLGKFIIKSTSELEKLAKIIEKKK